MSDLDPASDRTYIAQALDSSGLLKKTLITNKVTTCIFNTPAKPISYTLHARSLAGARSEVKTVAIDEKFDLDFDT